VSTPEREGTDQPERRSGGDGPQSPGQAAAAGSPGGPQSPAGPQSPVGPHPTDSPQSPGPAGAPGYSGPVPPGGWGQPVARPSVLPAGVQLASWGSRVGATVLDALVLTVAMLVLIAPGVLVLSLTDITALGVVLTILGAVAALVVALLYAAYFMKRPGTQNGQTLGKQWVGIRVVFVDGKQFGWGQGLLREIVIKQILVGVASSLASLVTFFLLGLGGFVPYLLDYLWPLWDDENRAIHDMVVNTRVIRA
jgi:uncharacterized RDD family membrane protein YckC